MPSRLQLKHLIEILRVVFVRICIDLDAANDGAIRTATAGRRSLGMQVQRGPFGHRRSGPSPIAAGAKTTSSTKRSGLHTYRQAADAADAADITVDEAGELTRQRRPDDTPALRIEMVIEAISAVLVRRPPVKDAPYAAARGLRGRATRPRVSNSLHAFGRARADRAATVNLATRASSSTASTYTYRCAG